jgi:hypothetical protein
MNANKRESKQNTLRGQEVDKGFQVRGWAAGLHGEGVPLAVKTVTA